MPGDQVWQWDYDDKGSMVLLRTGGFTGADYAGRSHLALEP
nr:hypothetical protein [Escherichia coli]